MTSIIGIDLGTTNSVVAYYDGKNVKVIENQEGGRTTPSVIAFDKNNQKLVGEVAKRQIVTNPEHTYYAVKRLIGKSFKDIGALQKHLSYTIIEGSNGDAWIKGKDKNYSPQELSAAILKKMKETAEKHLGHSISEAVVTVPAYFNDMQRQATKDAGRIAGLEIKRIINEPTAAALAYGLEKKYQGKEKKIVVYDLGGGTFDVSILEISEDVFEVVSTNGDTELGGEDFDHLILQYILDDFKSKTKIDLSKDKVALQRVKEEAEKAKKELSTSMMYDVNLPFITNTSSGVKNLECSLSRSKVESLVAHLIDKTLVPCKQALKDAKLDISEIDDIVMVGGMTRMPLVQKKVQEFFKKELHTGVNPDEVVALGAANQAAILDPSISASHDVVLLDVTPLSLGIETEGGVFTTIIEKNTTVPTKKSQIFSTASDNQRGVTISVYQGERKIAKHNKSLGRFDLQNIPPAPRGIPQIEVSFDIDANGILHVTAKDKATNKEQAIRIQASGGLSEQEIENMINEAQQHEEADKKQQEEIESINTAHSLIYKVKEDLEKYNDKIQDETRKSIEDAVKELEEELNKDQKDLEILKTKTQNLVQASIKLGEFLYKENANTPDVEEHSEEDVIDTACTEENKENK